MTSDIRKTLRERPIVIAAQPDNASAESSYLNHAQRMAKFGLHIFPCVDNGKFPHIERFPERATRDPAQIATWWTDPVMGWEQP